MFHGVADETGHGVGDVKVVAVGGSHQNVVAHEVADGEVPPDVCLAVDAGVYPFHGLLVDAVHHGVTGPHDVNVFVHLRTERTEITFGIVSPGAVVLCRAENERSHVFVDGDEMVIDIVQQVCLLVGFCSFTPDVVKEDGESANAEGIHLLQLRHEVVSVFHRPFDIYTRMDCPVELHTVFLCVLVEFLDAGSLILGIRFSPLIAVVGVILRTVDIDVHLVTTVEFNLTETGFVTPGRAVEAFDRAAIGDIGPVRHFRFLQFAFCHGRQQGLHAPEEAGLIGSSDDCPLLVDAKIISLVAVGNHVLHLRHALVAFHAKGHGEGSGGRNAHADFVRFQRIGGCTVTQCICRHHLPRFGKRKTFRVRHLHFVGHGVHQRDLSRRGERGKEGEAAPHHRQDSIHSAKAYVFHVWFTVSKVLPCVPTNKFLR